VPTSSPTARAIRKPSPVVGNLLLYCWALLAMGAAIGAWSLATPLMAAPDEPHQAIEAAAVVRGQLDAAEHPTDVGPVAVVRVPAWMASTNSVATCLIWEYTRSAACAPPLNSGTETVEATTQFSRYPPLYYALVGIPSLLSRGAPALYSMRMVGTLVNSSLIALGLFLLTRYHPRRRHLMAGVLVALSPMVFFVSSVLNPSGMEIAAGFAAWCAGLCVIERRRVSTALAVWTSLAFVVLMLSRPPSPGYAAVILFTLGILVGWSRSKELLRDRGTLPIRLSIVGALIAWGLTLIIAGGAPPFWGGIPYKPRLSLWRSIWLTLSLTVHRLRQCVGDFGWINTPVPETVWVVWASALTVLVSAGLYVSSRCRRALPVLALVIIAIPVIFESPTIDSFGIWWQGRYWLPLLIGAPLVAVSQISTREDVRRWTDHLATVVAVLMLGIILIAAQVWTFVVVLQRYEFGWGFGPGAIGHWAPPGGAAFVTGLFILGMVLLLGFVTFNLFRSRTQPSDDERHDDHDLATRGPFAVTTTTANLSRPDRSAWSGRTLWRVRSCLDHLDGLTGLKGSAGGMPPEDGSSR